MGGRGEAKMTHASPSDLPRVSRDFSFPPVFGSFSREFLVFSPIFVLFSAFFRKNSAFQAKISGFQGEMSAHYSLLIAHYLTHIVHYLGCGQTPSVFERVFFAYKCPFVLTCTASRPCGKMSHLYGVTKHLYAVTNHSENAPRSGVFHIKNLIILEAHYDQKNREVSTSA
jgi:hypothetical protein